MGASNPEFQWVYDLFETVVPGKLNERALILADTVSYEIWGGARGWEKATDEQFETLVRKLKERLRDGDIQERPSGRVAKEAVPSENTAAENANKKRCCDDQVGLTS